MRNSAVEKSEEEHSFEDVENCVVAEEYSSVENSAEETVLHSENQLDFD